MRLPAVLVVLALGAGCGESAASPPRGPATEVASAPVVSRPAAPSAGAVDLAPVSDAGAEAGEGPEASSAQAVVLGPMGHLTGAGHLAHAFQALATLEEGRAHRDVLVVQYGDSHTAADLGVSVFRRALQARFGDGGRGFVPLGRPWKGFGADGVRGSMDKAWSPAKIKFHKGAFVGEGGCYGLLGIGIETSKAGASASTDLLVRAPRLELAYAEDPRGGSFDVFVDGSRVGRIATRAPAPGPAHFAYEVADAAHHVEVRAVGDGEVRVFGVAADRPEAGVVVDALGINGAQIFTPLRWGEACVAAELEHAAPDLVVLAYGTNEALEPGLTDAQIERGYVDMLGRVARAVPSASCLLLGPTDLARRTRGRSDWKTWPRVQEVVALERRVAEAAGCAFYDQMEAMGGEGAMAQWASEPQSRASGDRVHLRRSGYAQLGAGFAADVMHAYDAWRAARGLFPVAARPPAAPTTTSSSRAGSP